MARRKNVFTNWTIVLLVVIYCECVVTRPQDSPASTTISVQTDKPTENPIRDASPKQPVESKKPEEVTSHSPVIFNTSRTIKNKTPIIGEAMKMVANQLLENPVNKTSEDPIVIDTRIPPKLKNQIQQKHKIKTRNEDGVEIENSHAGIAVPVTMEDLEKENKISESSTSIEGISTWILLSNTANKENLTTTEPTKVEESQKKPKPNSYKNKTKRPQSNKPIAKRPIIGSTNKSDLVAGGSAINENVYNKLKDTVLSNVQKNKNTSQRPSTTTTTVITSTEESIKSEATTKPPSSTAIVKVTSKPSKKKKNKNKNKTTTLAPIVNDSALLPMEPKEQEIELEISTPATTTKKPKRNSTKKKNKTKKRKTSKLKPAATSVTEVKTSNKTKTTKQTKKPTTSLTGQVTSQIYQYFSREVMPSVGVGVLSLAGLVGLAGYFLYPFAAPVRRTFEVDKKDDLYRHNAEEYANEGNGQAEEEMLGTVLAGMPAHSKQKLNPYAGQTPLTRYPVKKEQDIRYRQVAQNYDPNYNHHYPQQKTGIAHGVVYPEHINYKQYETRHVYTTEGKYAFDKGQNSFTQQSAVEPIYAVPQTGPQSGPAASAYGNDAANSVVYGIKPSSESDFKPVYPYEGQFYSETTSSPITYPPTSMYLGSNNEQEVAEEQKYSEGVSANEEEEDNKFVVGNVPKELSETATPAVVPEHGPRNLRRRRSISRKKRSIVGSIEEIIKADKENKDVLSNEIDETLGVTKKSMLFKESISMNNKGTISPATKDVYTVYAMPIDPKEEKTTIDTPSTAPSAMNNIVESVSTVPIDDKSEKITESDMSNELDVTTNSIKLYEVFSSGNPNEAIHSSPIINDKLDTTTQFKTINTETTTESKFETTSTVPSESTISEKDMSTELNISTLKPTNNPEVLTYPPLNQNNGGFFTFLKRLIEFKYRLGLSILQTTSDNLNRYLRSMERSVSKASRS